MVQSQIMGGWQPPVGSSHWMFAHAPHVPLDVHACVPQQRLLGEQLCVVLAEPVQAPAVHWQEDVQVSGSVPHWPHACCRVLLGAQTP